ncbi:hypothetical protein [Aquimarina aggregata]|uniref:hypothetical protein n=1 Tax=Aquimarina aggregata TaxID=1642818 RepID=UPI0024927079|nr:hypothetical protein [Aquimarina aggregata]
MAFKLEELTDEKREAFGFVRSRGDAPKWRELGAAFVFDWGIDDHLDAQCYRVKAGLDENLYEIRWKGEYIKFHTQDSVTKLDDVVNTQNKACYYVVDFIVIPQNLAEELDTIKQMIADAKRVLWFFNGEINGKISDDVKIEIVSKSLSDALLENFLDKDVPKVKGFHLEYPTDDEREAFGFARTMYDLKMSNGMRCKYVDIWAIDRDREACLVQIEPGIRTGAFELHWPNYTMRIDFEQDMIISGDESVIEFGIRKVSIPKDFEPKEKREEAFTLLSDALEGYGYGKISSPEAAVIPGRMKLLDDIEMLFPEKVASRLKISDAISLQ